MEQSKLDKLKLKVQKEYNEGYLHINQERDRKRSILGQVLPINIEEGFVKVPLLLKNLKLERSLFLTDDLSIQFACNEGVLGKEVMDNANKVAIYDDEDMDMIETREQIIDDNVLYGLAVTVVNDWDSEEVQPISETIDPLSVIPDPLNWRGNKMRFIGFERKVSIEDLKGNPAYDKKVVSELELGLTAEQLRTERQRNTDNNTTYVGDDSDIVGIYDHFTCFEGKKYLVTTDKAQDKILRVVELEGLSEAEIKNPKKVRYPVQLHRRCPKPRSFFGVSTADEILQYQDVITNITNYEIINARLSNLGPDKLVSQDLGIDTNLLASKKPGGRIIEVANLGQPIGASVYEDRPMQPSQYPIQVKNEINQLSQEITGTGSLAFGQSPQGNQTKSEIQTLMQNTNALLTYIGNNYLRGQKEYWKAHYRAYALYMKPRSTKVISFYQKGNNISLELKKEDFIVDGKVQVTVVSKNQEALINEKNSAKILGLANLYLGNMKPGRSMNEFLRKVGDLMGIKDFDASDYITYSVDETVAMRNLNLLNADREVPSPKPGEDFKTFIDIYSQAMNTKAKRKALLEYELAWEETGRGQDMMQGQGDAQTGAMAMNMLSNEQSTANTAQGIEQSKI